MRLLLIAICLLAATAQAQAPAFGSADDPAEAPVLRPSVSAFGGPSYIGVRWRVGGGAFAEGSVGPFNVALDARLRAGTGGIYREDVDELYDLLRVVRYARLEPTAQRPLYVRFGPLQRVTLGDGLLVRNLGSVAAWDERTVGAEAALHLPRLRVEAFTSDLRPEGLVGGRVAVRPFYRPGLLGLSSLSVAGQAVHRLGDEPGDPLTAFGGDVRFDVAALGDFRVQPFASYARYTAFGQGGSVGVTLTGDDLAELGRLGASAGLTLSDERFIPGYLNAFHPVHRPGARIVDSEAFFSGRPAGALAGTALAEADAGLAFFFELRAVVFGAFELRQFVRRDFAGATGAYGLGATLAPGGGQTFRFIFDLQRQGLDGLTELFSDRTDEVLMAFHLDYNLPGPARLFLRSRYGYRRLDDSADGTQRFLVERRFEPFVGVRFQPERAPRIGR